MPDLSRSLVLDFRADGSVECLLKDKVLDTRFLSDTRKIERVSEIIPTDDGQKFMIRWLLGPLVWNDRGNKEEWRDHSKEWRGDHDGHLYRVMTRDSILCYTDGEPVYFDTYEEAVEREVMVVNVMRLNGVSFQ